MPALVQRLGQQRRDYRTNAGLMLSQRLRRWANINPALVQRLVFADFLDAECPGWIRQWGGQDCVYRDHRSGLGISVRRPPLVGPPPGIPGYDTVRIADPGASIIHKPALQLPFIIWFTLQWAGYMLNQSSQKAMNYPRQNILAFWTLVDTFHAPYWGLNYSSKTTTCIRNPKLVADDISTNSPTLV